MIYVGTGVDWANSGISKKRHDVVREDGIDGRKAWKGK